MLFCFTKKIQRLNEMKKLSLIILIAIFCSNINAQEVRDTSWTISGQASINFSQVSFSNWVAGGRNSVSGVGIFNINANYQKDRLSWENSLKSGYGLLKEGEKETVKTEDKFEINSKVGIESRNNEHLLYSSFVNFNTQFANGYNYPNTTDVISTWFAPAYLTVAAGIDYKPSKAFSLFVSPVSGKFTFVTDEELSNQGAFGVDPGKTIRSELGAILKTEVKTTVVTNVDLSTALTLFSNYLENPQNIDVNWDVILNMKINDYLSANLLTTLIYDHDVLVPLDDQGNTGRRIQFKQLLGVGLSYNF